MLLFMPFGQIVVLCLSGLTVFHIERFICGFFFFFKVGVQNTRRTAGMCRNKMNGGRLTCRHIGGGVCCFH